ncbi:hypothetical protein M8J77_012890 [Diaphorina citri]|nr:hypothetical protein M8J77_012890 [Diaphorina citri]
MRIVNCFFTFSDPPLHVDEIPLDMWQCRRCTKLHKESPSKKQNSSPAKQNSKRRKSTNSNNSASSNHFKKLRSGKTLYHRKDIIPPDELSGVYSLRCECGCMYVGMTRRSLKTRITEHFAAARNNKPEKSNFAQHIFETGHDLNKAEHKMLWVGSHFRDILYHEQIEIHNAMETGKCVNEIVEMVPNLVYLRNQLIYDQVTVPPPPLSLSAATITTTQ